MYSITLIIIITITAPIQPGLSNEEEHCPEKITDQSLAMHYEWRKTLYKIQKLGTQQQQCQGCLRACEVCRGVCGVSGVCGVCGVCAHVVEAGRLTRVGKGCG